MKPFDQYPTTRVLWRHVLLIACLLISVCSMAQLSADFSMDRNSGCAPLAVQFVNKTSGASPSARYVWNFGNGNTSLLFSPAATYRTEKTYIITLTVTDKGVTSSKTDTLTVYRKPSVDFGVSQLSGCLPHSVQFNSSVAAGDGTITAYIWDFGDGNIARGESVKAPAHTYGFPQVASVGLSVTNSHGCITTVEKPNLVQVFAPVKAQFEVDKQALCGPGESVRFTNTSTGADPMSYLWHFGDGTTSTEKSPLHVYARKGIFSVKLQVTSSKGCTDEVVQNDLIYVASFSNSIELPQVVCSSNTLPFQAVSSPAADSVRWDFGPGVASSSLETSSPAFPQAGLRSISLTSYWGGCSQTTSTQIRVVGAPVISKLVPTLTPSCELPYRVVLKDTAAKNAGWLWEYPGTQVQTTSEATFHFNQYGVHPVMLTVTNDSGCKVSHIENVRVVKPGARIGIAHTSSRFGTADCVGMKIRFRVIENTPVESYFWTFGDGGTATGPSPEHIFNKAGKYNVKLRYITANGCHDSTVYREVAVYSKPKIDFSGPTVACSSTPVGFLASADTAVRQLYWYYGATEEYDTASGSNLYTEHKFLAEGVYTVRLIANNGLCADTVIKKDYIQVLPPFQNLQTINYDCGDRNSVEFMHFTRGGLKMEWTFGDGTNHIITNDGSQQVYPVKHAYPGPGVYKAYFTATNGSCSTIDSALAIVPGKQNPVVTASKAVFCLDEKVEITIAGVKTLKLTNGQNPFAEFFIKEIRYNDGSLYTGTYQVKSGNWDHGMVLVLDNFDRFKTGIQVFVASTISGCVDASELCRIKMAGPVAAIKPQVPVCLNDLAVFRDDSKGNDIVSWEWKVADSSLAVRTTSESVSWRFAIPGTYPVRLKVTDAVGCSSTANMPAGVKVLGAKAGFALPDTLVAINTPVQFTNTSQTIGGTSVSYAWTSNNGNKTSSSQHLQTSYPQIGRDTVRLIAYTAEGGCADTLVQSLMADNIHAKFSYKATYLNSNSCPPMLVRFVNLSRNSRSNLWVFGDGSTAQNLNNPDHTYMVGGSYRVVLYTFGPNNIVDSASEVITVRGASATITADKFSGCLNQRVMLTAKVNYALDYYWDYGDGTVLRTRDTFAVHDYLTAGIYKPSLIMSDSTGCLVAAELGRPVVIDSLSIAIGGIPTQICDSARVRLTPQVVSLAADLLGESLEYSWKYGTATSKLAAPTFNFRGEGQHPVQVTAVSAYGCKQTALDTLFINRTLKGSISGPGQICVSQPASFDAQVPQAASWRWLLPDGSTAKGLQSPVQSFRDSGFYPVRLEVGHQGCYDTASLRLWVHPLPAIRFANNLESICRGKSATLQASGGATYQWTSNAAIAGGAQTARPEVAPLTDAWYQVKATSFFGCQSTDSMQVKVVQPFKMKVLPEVKVCSGLDLDLHAAGAADYRWSGPAQTLHATTGATVKASPVSTSVYTVIGRDSARCFTDTANIHVEVIALPMVKAGPDQLVLTGSDVTLSARVSKDVVGYKWAPADYLSCTTCPQPVSQPRKPIAYTVTVTSKDGCIASDTMQINLTCTDSRIYIPNAFTPDKNGLNETFGVRGRGIAQVRNFMIFDRWGSVVFQCTNMTFEDAKASWDGTVKGQQAPAGTYVYLAELTCDTGEPLVKKGTVVLIR